MSEVERLDSEDGKRRAEARLAASRPAREAAAREIGARIWEMGATVTLGPDLTLKELVDGPRKY